RLLHIHLPSRGPSLYPPYTIASRVQEHLRRRQLDFKDSSAYNRPTGKRPPPGPPPTLLSFTPLPTYTLGRRQTAPLEPGELARLQAPLVHYPPTTTTSVNDNHNDSDNNNKITNAVTVIPSPRGGLTTYHGPGQIVLWPVLDLRSKWHKTFTVRCYSRLLEDTTIATLSALTWPAEGSVTTHLKGFTTDDPGVWVNTAIQSGGSRSSSSSSSSSSDTTTTTDTETQSGPQIAKIAALGVHLRRHVSALGTAINVNMPGPEDLNPASNPWARIVACGLEGKTVTSIHRELEARLRSMDELRPSEEMKDGLTEQVVAREWANELSKRLLCEE
ncbi:hypothetical protein V8F20_004626, partial [Naviculisporaceae sp. PSN 640]